jgi:hypothetical protein
MTAKQPLNPDCRGGNTLKIRSNNRLLVGAQGSLLFE